MDGLYWKTILKRMIWGYHYYRGILSQHAHGLSFEGIFWGAARELAVKALF